MSTYYMVATYHYIKTLVQHSQKKKKKDTCARFVYFFFFFFFFMNLLSANGLKEQNLNKGDEHHEEFQD
jgi:hypothetical protein